MTRAVAIAVARAKIDELTLGNGERDDLLDALDAIVDAIEAIDAPAIAHADTTEFRDGALRPPLLKTRFTE